MQKTVRQSPLHLRSLFDVIDGKYKPLQELGSGGVCRVDLARDIRTGDEVAIKRLSGSKWNSADARTTLRIESAALGRLSTPSVPRLRAASLSGEDPYLAMEFVDGQKFSLNSLKRVSVEHFLKLAIHICGTLSAIHEAGIIHRDMKPSNLMLSDDLQRVSILDFGFAVVSGMEPECYSFAKAVGTPMFMAPEQTYPHANVDRRADIYSAGIIMYNFLTGSYPYPIVDDSPEGMMELHRSAHAPLMSERNGSISPRLSYVIARAMCREPEKRFSDAEELADALSGCCATSF